MTEKDIVRLAEEAELWLHTDRKYEAVEKFAKLVAAAEREACAKVCEEPGWNAANWCAKAIRARGQE
jgi:hypothetical protein